MNSPRSILFIAFLVVSFFLYQNWLIDTAPAGTQKPAQTQTSTGESSIPEASSIATANDSAVPEASDAGMPASVTTNTSQRVRVTTDVLDVLIDTHGGDVVNAQLLQFAQTQDSTARFELLHADPNKLYIAQSGLVGANGTDSAQGRPMFHVEQSSYNMSGDKLEVPLHFTQDDGSKITKTFIFTKGSYAVDVVYT